MYYKNPAHWPLESILLWTHESIHRQKHIVKHFSLIRISREFVLMSNG